MCIENYLNMLEEICNKILNDKLKYKNSIIIGDNSSGKSELIKLIFSKQIDGYYFIDSVNRTFDFSRINSTKDLEISAYKSVVNRRINDETKFNLVDSFDLSSVDNGAIEQIYLNYEDKIQILFEKMLGLKMKRITEDIGIGRKRNIIQINDEYDKLSNGFQAIIRLFLEILFFEDYIEENVEFPFVVIDEINEFLSINNEQKILPFLMKEFKNINYIVTTHSEDVIMSSIDCNIIAIRGNNYEILDGNDFNTTTEIREIFNKIYSINTYENEENQIDGMLRNLLNIKISNTWTEIEEDKLNQIDEKILTNSQIFLLNQIRNWK